jgi:hypothetical protein
MKTGGTIMKVRITFAVAAILSIVFFLMMSSSIPREAEASGNFFAKSFAGTFFIEEEGGEYFDIWTLTEDGNFFGTNSAQLEESFNDQQGVWKKTGHREVTATILNFDFDSDGSLIAVARADIVMDFSKRFQTVEGSYALRYFEGGEDPLCPETDTGDPLTIEFTGRRVVVN